MLRGEDRREGCDGEGGGGGGEEQWTWHG